MRDWSIESSTVLEEMRSDALDEAYERKNERYVSALWHATEECDDADFWGTRKERKETREALKAFYDECQYEGIDVPRDLEDEVARLLNC